MDTEATRRHDAVQTKHPSESHPLSEQRGGWSDEHSRTKDGSEHISFDRAGNGL